MIVGICTVELRLAGNHSLKGKRSALKPLMARLRREFNIAAAEIDQQDDWQFAQIGLATIANSRVHVDQVLQAAVRYIEESRLDLELVDYQIEILA
ncbi:MAG TPA: DUF503 domain-containing protein [Anaerolineae bacterium]|nr:DUF503 domain-containing protein [Anaerolineae bacterium]